MMPVFGGSNTPREVPSSVEIEIIRNCKEHLLVGDVLIADRTKEKEIAATNSKVEEKKSY